MPSQTAVHLLSHNRACMALAAGKKKYTSSVQFIQNRAYSRVERL